MVHHPLNENLQNIVPRKAVPCDIVKELFKVRDTLLDSADRNTIKVYEVAYEKFFEEYEERGSATANDVLGSCYDFIKYYSKSEKGIDVVIDSSDYRLAEEGKYQGICKLPNGAEVIVFQVVCDEQPSELYQVLYFDGTELRVFTPFSGNAVNAVTMTALGDEDCTLLEKLEGDLYSKVYPNGLPEVAESNFAEAARLGYLQFLGYTEKEFQTGIRSDKKLVDKEIETVLS